ncbi:MAG: intramembrane serine protease GlpG [Methanocella sp. PtaU1.Bin125]|nr:MAG: intramembrane serine protease GlpG [Methanocella sp. PtaU1.Bin125]
MADNRCDFCDRYEMLPFNCKYCGGVFCSSHRLPEYHNCPGLKAMKQGNWKPPAQARKPQPGNQRRKKLRLPRVRLPGQGFYAYGIIALCVIMFILQFILPPALTNALVLSGPPQAEGPLSTIVYILTHAWTTITYMFLHANIMHIFFNMLMLFFFGPLLERQIGSVRFLGLYLGSGVLAGLVQVLIFPGAVIGASAAVFGVMGALAMLMPDLRIYLYFVPMKIIYAVILFAVLDLLLIPSGDQVAHAAHLVGLAAGLAYGYLIKKNKGTVQAYYRV